MSPRKKYVRGQDLELDAKLDAISPLSPATEAYARGKLDAQIERSRAEADKAVEQRRRAREEAAAGNKFSRMSIPAMEKDVREHFTHFEVLSKGRRAIEVLLRRKRRLEGETADQLVLRLGWRRRGYLNGLTEQRRNDEEEQP